MRGKVYVDSADGLMSLMHSASYDLSYPMLYEILSTNPRVLYFERKTDQEQFLLLYPELKGQL